MPYNKSLYTLSDAVIDAGIIYDRNEKIMQSNINALMKAKAKDFSDGRYADYYGQYIVTKVNDTFPTTQGMCIGNGCIHQMHVVDNVVAVYYKVGLGGGTVGRHNISKLTHYNDLTYYKDTDVVIGVDSASVVIIDPSDYSIVKEVTLSVNLSQIAYIDTGKIVGSNGQQLYFFDVDAEYNFTLTKTINISENYTKQGMCYYDGRLYISSYITPYPYYQNLTPEFDYGINISVYDLYGNKITSIKVENAYGECEGIDVYQGDLIISCQRRYDELNYVQSFLRLPLYGSNNKYTSLMFNGEGYLPGKQAITVYVDSQYTGFFCDGSESKPFIGAQEAINHCEHLTNTDITLNISNGAGLINFPYSKKIYRITGSTIRRITSYVEHLFLTNCTIGNSDLTGAALWMRYCECHLRGCTIIASDNYCVDTAYSKLIMETTSNTFMNGTYGIRAVFNDIINDRQNIYTNITTAPYYLSNCRVVDAYLPEYIANTSTSIESIVPVNGSVSSVVTSNNDYKHSYKNNHLVVLNYYLTVTSVISSNAAVNLITGLPVPKQQFQFIARASDGNDVKLKIDSSGKLQVWYNNAQIEVGTVILVNGISYFTTA